MLFNMRFLHFHLLVVGHSIDMRESGSRGAGLRGREGSARWLLCEQDIYSLSCYNNIAIFTNDIGATFTVQRGGLHAYSVHVVTVSSGRDIAD